MKKPNKKSPTWTFRTLNVSMDLRYSYDANGRITSRYEQSWATNYTPEITNYQYDAAGRLTNLQYPSGMTEAYTYDRAGNRITLTNSITGTTYYTYDGENKLIYTNHSGDITNYAYDGMGNTISGGGSTTMTYDYERRLTSITLPSGDTVTYKYLPDGTRIMRANNTDTEYYLYDREDRIGDYDENGNLMIAYTHGPGVDEPVAMTVNGSTYFYIPDIQGSIRAIVDTSGNLMASYVYDVWGNLISHNGPLSEKNDYLYTGREYDWETGIYYYRARSYNPELGRFLQQDPEGMVDGPNMYVYVRDDAVNRIDPEGTYPFSWLWCGWKALGFAKQVLSKYKYTTDKWKHAWVGCKLRHAGCSYSDTRWVAGYREETNPSGYDELDIRATMLGWTWGGEEKWACSGWWIFYSCRWVPKDCKTVVWEHWRELPR